MNMRLFRNKARFVGEKLLAPHLTPQAGDHPLSAVRDCVCDIFAATPHIGDRSSICNLRTHHVMVTGAHLSWGEAWSGLIWLRIGTGGGHL